MGMARKTKRFTAKSSRSKPRSSGKASEKGGGAVSVFARIRLWAVRITLALVIGLLGSILIYRFLPPLTTATIVQSSWRNGGVEWNWLPIEDIPEDLRRAALAAEDARFCQHWGFDMAAIRAALEGGAARGASTISQQTVKNVWLWQGRSWPRKAMEALITPLVELAWPKRRILEVYLNVAEFDEGVFGVEAGAYRYFGKLPSELSLREAALLVSVLPNPVDRDAGAPSRALAARAASIADGAQTLARDGRASCIED